VDCRATIGEVSNTEHNLREAGQGRCLKRWHAASSPTVRGAAMNPVDHPHGGGEGRTGTGQPPRDPWGNLTKGYRTRHNRRTQNMIVSRRKK
jgi:large subunit ribosomal protein L2